MRRPARLSGGEQQRVALARALANQPCLLLADEPTGNLDSAGTASVLRLLGRAHQQGQAILLVTHDARVASMADRVISMYDGIVADDAAVQAPSDPAVSGTQRAVLAGLTGACGLALGSARTCARARARSASAPWCAGVVAALLLSAPCSKGRPTVAGPVHATRGAQIWLRLCPGQSVAGLRSQVRGITGIAGPYPATAATLAQGGLRAPGRAARDAPAMPQIGRPVLGRATG